MSDTAVADTTVAIPEKERDPLDDIPDRVNCMDCNREFMNIYKIKFQQWNGQELPIRVGRCGHCNQKNKNEKK